MNDESEASIGAWGIPPDARELARSLSEGARATASAAASAKAALRARENAAESDFQENRDSLLAKFTSANQAAELEVQTARLEESRRFEVEHVAARKSLKTRLNKALRAYKEIRSKAVRVRKQARFETHAVFEVRAKGLEKQAAEAKAQAVAARDAIATLRQAGLRLMAEYRQRLSADSNAGEATSPAPWGETPRPIAECLTTAQERLTELNGLTAPRMLTGATPLGLLLAIAVASAIPAYFVAGFPAAAIVSTVVTILGGGGILWRLFVVARRQCRSVHGRFSEAIAEATAARARDLKEAESAYLAGREANRVRRQTEFAEADKTLEDLTREQKSIRDRAVRRANEKYVASAEEITGRRDRGLRRAEEQFARQTSDLKRQYEISWHAMHDAYEAKIQETRQSHDQKWEQLSRLWNERLAAALSEVSELQQVNRRWYPPWSDPVWESWGARSEAPHVLRFGSLAMRRDRIAGELPLPSEFPLPNFDTPAFLSFAERPSLLIRAKGEGKAKAIETLRAIMLRLLLASPPGKVKFTIIDPVGLGRNFAAFMHLTDYDESLVNGRIWTEANHIEARLGDLTEQMETLIQNFLRDEFATIAEYNARAGTMAEPLRVLVIAGFPTNFTEDAARRLASIAASGPRCGVFTLMSIDAGVPLPPGIDLADLARRAETVEWRDGAFVWKDEELSRYPLKLESPPPPEEFTRLIKLAGEMARGAQRVEAPFEIVAPPVEEWWRGDSGRGISVPLGPAGATRRQSLELGQGTSQHALIAGKTGSGKSTLLHALITNVSLLYDPDQVQLYLVDFKKGVEFKTYAARALPHARVVAIESDREFGLSVLQRLDTELKRRGELFRAVGAQDLAGYRHIHGKASMPRVLLIVDEFQEFFVEEDKLAQEAGLLLDRLVRQGRAFGMHVLLGSQTLGGAYSLARSTIGQMAVRVALQCGEADAHLILSEDNTAARLLSRPGEAIYNDGNGLLEANHPFQVAWLSDAKRDDYLRRIAELPSVPRLDLPPAIVFEGNVPADLERNLPLSKLAAESSWPDGSSAPPAWLGEAVAIKPPTAVEFPRSNGANLLLVGQDEDAALGIMQALIVSLSCQHPPAPLEGGNPVARFQVLHAQDAQDQAALGFSRLGQALPHALESVGREDALAIVAELAAEVACRVRDQDLEATARFLFVYDLGRFRAFRRVEDDFQFGRSTGETATSPARQLAAILRDGPSVGVHVIAWVDTLNNLQRTFDRQTIREFESRVLFQMNAADSSHLIDSPLASRLGPHRALYVNETLGAMEKFRPYRAPEDAWIRSLREGFEERWRSASVVKSASEKE